MSDSLRPHGLQHATPPCPSTAPRVYTNSCPLSQWCHPTIPSSVVPFSSSLQSFPASGSFQMSQLLAWGGQSIGVSASASALPMNTQDWSPLGWTGWISLVQGTLESLLQHSWTPPTALGRRCINLLLFLQPFTGGQGQGVSLRTEQRRFRFTFRQRGRVSQGQAIMYAYRYRQHPFSHYRNESNRK